MRKDIEQALEKFKVNTFGNKKIIEKVEALLRADEQVLYISPTNVVVTAVNTNKKNKLPGVFVLTDNRILFHYKIAFDESTDTSDLSKIDSINCFGNGLTGGHVEVHTRTKTYDILVSYKKALMNEIKNTFEEAINNYTQNKVSGNKESDTDILQQIEKLAELRNKDILTEEEFQEKKQVLMARL
ncbi:SHOCT domain-containing protein [Paenibacillus paeoniae]|uniref:SHOCT domain-containing protein n=1 Tax=Paenibacillus paeoniae TaxID=2292705 RepID=A0A371PPU5_9BACL|nr:SHOCT domain-containing protein [Paenibacillus paeoniae]REK77749.1 SHOCT domain-containing protein [Paenibacillus paeoniae]